MDVRVRLGRNECSISGPGGELLFDLTKGTFSLHGPDGKEAFSGATSRAELAEASYPLSAGYARRAEGLELSEPLGSGMALKVVCEPEGAGPRLIFEARCYNGLKGFLLALVCENTFPQALVVRALEVLRVRSREGARFSMLPYPPAARFYHTGATMAGSPFVELAKPPKDLKAWAESCSSELMGCLARSSLETSAFLWGFVTASRLPSRVGFGLEPGGEKWGEITASCDCENRERAPGESIKSELLYIDVAGCALDAMERYAEVLAHLGGARTGPGEVPTGWCSWYYFFADVTQEDVLSNLRYIAAHRDKYPLRYVQIDDGYQKHWGDWLETSNKFPDGMAALAAKIKELGFVPGLWLAPFVASPASELARAHPDWLVRNLRGEKLLVEGWGPESPWHVLDGTHPAVQDHLEKLARTVVQDWGYEYLKLDAMDKGAPAGALFADRRATRVEAYRRGFEAIRRGAGRAFILGCNALFGPSVGLADGMRVSMDVGPVWGNSEGVNARSALRSAIRRWFFHRKTWWNDPDCLIVRGPEGQRPGLTLDEARTLTAGIGLLGGMLLLSDDLPHLQPERAELHEMLFPPNDRAARPLDLFEHDPPSILALRVDRPWESWHIAAVINWLDSPAEKRFDLDKLGLEPAPARYHVFELFERHYYGAAKGELELGLVRPHATKLLCIRRTLDRPQLVSTTFHLLQGVELSGCEWLQAEQKLRVIFSLTRRRTGKVYIWSPPELGVRSVGGSCMNVKQSSCEGGLIGFELEAEDGSVLEVAFEPLCAS